jgi:hypothetical protein
VVWAKEVAANAATQAMEAVRSMGISFDQLA